MAFCRNCGAAHDEGASYCTSCGDALPDSFAAKQLPPLSASTAPKVTVSEVSGRSGLATWLTADWPAAAFGAGLLLLILMAGSIVYGTVLTVVTTGDPSAALDGVIVGVYLVFAAMGASVRVAVLNGSADAAFSLASWPVGLTLVACVAIWRVVRAMIDRRQVPLASVPATCAKVVLLVACVLTILSSVLSLTDPDGAVVANVDPRRTFVGAVLVTGLTCLLLLARRGASTLPEGVTRYGLDRMGRALATGAVAFSMLAVVAGAFTLVGAFVAADTGADRLRLLLGLPIVGVNLMLVSGVAALGSTVAFGLAGVSDVFGAGFEGSATATMSLFRFGFPPAASTGNAPFVVLVFFLLSGPALLAAAIATRMRREPSERALIGSWILLAALGFLGAAVLAGLTGQIRLYADATGIVGENNLVVIRPDLVTTLGYGTLWAALGSLGGWWAWLVLRATPSPSLDPVAGPTPLTVTT